MYIFITLVLSLSESKIGHQLQSDYWKVWKGFKNRFEESEKDQKE